MGSRGRSIRLRIYFLVAIPLITMLGLFGYVAYTSVTNWLNLDRAPSLIRATSVPLTNFVGLLQAERRAAVVYLSQPTAANLKAYQGAVQAAKAGLQRFDVVASSPATTKNATPAETAALEKLIADVNGMTQLRGGVSAKQPGALAAFFRYTGIIADQNAVFQAEAASMTDSIASSQGLGLISAVNAREDVSEQDALLAGALASGTLDGPSRVAFSQAMGRQQDDTLLSQALLSKPELAVFNKTMDAQVPASMRKGLTSIQEAVAAGTPLTSLQRLGMVSPQTWQELTSTWQRGNYQAATDAADAVLAVDQQLSDNAKKRVWETAAVGAAGLILTLLVTILLGRSINRRLARLRRSALMLAEEQLPSVVARLRRGEPVDVAAEAPPLRAGSDEIGQVGQAIDTVRQTAIRSAVEEARVRQGVNDMFRNLARRNQSLLQRQLTVLDGMERKTTDPDALEDLFRMDHLTTRMRRHAEGLIILSGAAPGRAWSAPVKLIDVMRGAVAEVEDYARVTVATQAKAALAGSAVTDVIHLLAELIENATTFSPPATQVRVSGETVANGFAIEIEDRGLGMPQQRLAELNERLANPPEINPANTDQLGLFVVGQLARRHGITVTLRPSPYGGTTAVALIPRGLIVAEGPAAITSGGAGEAAFAGPAFGGRNGHGGYGGYGNGQGQAASGAVTLPPTPASGNRGWTDSNELGYPAAAADAAPGLGSGPAGSSGRYGAGYDPGYDPHNDPGYDPHNDPSYDDPAPPATIRISGALRHPDGAADGGTGMPAGRDGRRGSADVPVVTGVPVGRPAAPPAAPFDVFTPLHRSGGATAAPRPSSYPDLGGTSDAGSYGASRGAGDSYGAGGYPAEYGTADSGDNNAADWDYPDGDPAAADDSTGLPRRVRQASLAPELRASAATAGSSGATAVPPASPASLAVMRNTLSALQRGWEQGRAQSQWDTEGNADGD